jgi:hypothetical protein
MNQNLHSRISYIKSAIRIIGFTCLIFDMFIGVLLLIIAEIFGIVEEIIL